ncbi:hypothetical protein Bca4012_028570 [Brassica carinata]
MFKVLWMKIRQPPPPTTTIVSILTSSTIASTTTTASTAVSTASCTMLSTATAIVSTGLSLEKGLISQDAKVRVWTEKTESSSCFKKRDLTFHLELICESPEVVKNKVSRSRNRDRDVDFDFGEKFGEKEDVEIQGERRPLQKRKGFIVRSYSSIRHARSPRLRTYLKTSIDEGVDEDFRKIRMSNSNIKEAIGDVAEGIEFLF